MNINWTSSDITDASSGLSSTPITLEYFDGSNWNTIVSGESNDGSYTWSPIASLDISNAKIRLTAVDNVGNTASQLSDSFTIDSTAPTISSVSTMDMDADGQIDAVNVVMSESIQDSSITL